MRDARPLPPTPLRVGSRGAQAPQARRASPYRAARGAAVSAIREAALYPAILRGGRRRVVFLPSHGRYLSSLLRAYNVAAGLKAHGWTSIVVPADLSLAQRRRILASFRPDLVVVQKCRHALNRLAFLGDWDLVLDVDDADFLDPALGDEMAALARRARGVICGSRFIRDWAARHNANAAVIWTGSPVSPGPWPDHASRRPIVTWAQTAPHLYENELRLVGDAVAAAAGRIGGLDLRLYGWDAPQDHPALERLRAAGVRVELLPLLPYEKFLLSLREAAVGLSPVWPEGFSRGKSFGKILGYLDAKTPVICSDEADHALFFTPETGVVSNEPARWVDAICELLGDPDRREKMADRAHAAFRERLSIAAVARRVDAFLSRLAPVESTGPPPRRLAEATPVA